MSPRSGFNIDLARCLAHLCALSYHPVVPPAVGPVRFTVIEVPGLDLRVVITHGLGRIDIAVRGTVDLRNWLTDLDVVKEPIAQGVLLHRGFLVAADRLLPLIVGILLPAGADKAKLPPIRVTGHSLGGGVAKPIAYFLAQAGFPVEWVYTFAAPRSGNSGWRKVYHAALGARTFRVAAAGDLVPLVPGLLDGYRHAGTEVFLSLRDGHQTDLRINPNHCWEIIRDERRARAALAAGDLDFILKFHSITEDYLPLMVAVTQ